MFKNKEANNLILTCVSEYNFHIYFENHFVVVIISVFGMKMKKDTRRAKERK